MKFITTILRDCESNKWFSFYPKWDYNSIMISESFYFDSRPHFSSNLTFIISLLLVPFLGIYSIILLPFLFWGWGIFYICLPFDSGVCDSEYRDWGFSFGSTDSKYKIEHFLIKKGKNYRFIDLPFLAMVFYRHSILLKDNTWYHSFANGEREEFWNDDVWGDKKFKETHKYTNVTTNGVIQEANATITVEEREWRRKWLTWTTLGNYKRKVIDISFDIEIGDRAGSWKGSCTGCSYDLKDNETPLECLRRMEKERSFKR